MIQLVFVNFKIVSEVFQKAFSSSNTRRSGRKREENYSVNGHLYKYIENQRW